MKKPFGPRGHEGPGVDGWWTKAGAEGSGRAVAKQRGTGDYLRTLLRGGVATSGVAAGAFFQCLITGMSKNTPPEG